MWGRVYLGCLRLSKKMVNPPLRDLENPKIVGCVGAGLFRLFAMIKKNGEPAPTRFGEIGGFLMI